MVDALALGASERKLMEVQVLSPVQTNEWLPAIFLFVWRNLNRPPVRRQVQLRAQSARSQAKREILSPVQKYPPKPLKKAYSYPILPRVLWRTHIMPIPQPGSNPPPFMEGMLDQPIRDEQLKTCPSDDVLWTYHTTGRVSQAELDHINNCVSCKAKSLGMQG